MLMLSPFANADEDKMVPLKEYLEANQKDILKSELLYVTFRCIALYSALPGIFEQIPEEQLKENNKDFDVWDWIDSKLELQNIVQLVSREFHYDLFDPTNDEYAPILLPDRFSNSARFGFNVSIMFLYSFGYFTYSLF